MPVRADAAKKSRAHGKNARGPSCDCRRYELQWDVLRKA